MSFHENPRLAGALRPSGSDTFLIRANEFAVNWLVLYAVTFALALLCGLIRAILAYQIFWIALKLLGEPTSPVEGLVALVAYGPLALSLATLVLPVGGPWCEQRSKARSPSQREQLVLDDAIATLKAANPGLRPPRRWLVHESDDPKAWVYADTLTVTCGLLESGYLQGVLAHELAHLNSSDARLAAALHRLTTPPRAQTRRGLIGTISLFASGGFALRVTRSAWASYWLAREHHADNYADDLGQAAALARFSSTHTLDGDLPVAFLGRVR
jgi:Zn-dependent protease with chaperone function